ncbi:hyccin [Thalictrum thalictroides]|uniref:Hyccin n=1 Tax=Thalictrum thalictroides TaxID=46969 RepID=A0A7J6V422_THATH|nr:hyccin [Thalictrum thalictroides]
MSVSDTKAQSAFQSLSNILGSIPLTVNSSESPVSFLLNNSEIAKQISVHLKQPNSGAGDDDLCRWLYNTFQSSDPGLQLVVLRFLPIIGGLYLSRDNLRKSLAGFEAILLAIYAYETTSRKGQPITVNVPDLSHPSLYHEVPITNTATELNLAILSQSLEPHGTIRSTKRARIVGVALELYYSKIAVMPVSSKIDFCEFCIIWAGQDGDMFIENEDNEEKGNGVEVSDDGSGDADASTSEDGVTKKNDGKQSEEKEGRIPLPWELLQPVLRILSHCLLGPTKSKELQEVAQAACRSLYARALHDVDPQAILATSSLLKLGKMAMDSTPNPDPTEMNCDFMNPVISL